MGPRPETAPPTPGIVRRGARLPLHRLLDLSLLALSLLTLRHALQALPFPYPLDYGEGPLLYQAVQLARGRGIYGIPGADPPYLMANYPPLYPLLLAPFARLFGPRFWYGRLLSGLSTLTAAVVLGLWVRRETGSRRAALLAALLFLNTPFVLWWGLLFRVDALGLALTLTALLWARTDPWSRRQTWGIPLLFVAAAYTRQTYALAAPLAVALILRQRDPRAALTFLGRFAGIALALFLLLNGATKGAFAHNAILANLNVWTPLRASAVGALALLFLSGPLLLALAALPRTRRATGLGRDPAVLYLLLSFLTGALSGKVGSNLNYFLEPAAAAALLAGRALARPPDLPRRLFQAGVGLYLILLWMGIADPLYLRPFQTYRGQRAALRTLEARIAATPDPILADFDLGLLVRQGRTPYLQPCEMTLLAADGRWDPTPLVRAVETRTFPLILQRPPLAEGCWPPAVRRALEGHYRPLDRIAGTWLYVPRTEKTGAAPLSRAPEGGTIQRRAESRSAPFRHRRGR